MSTEIQEEGVDVAPSPSPVPAISLLRAVTLGVLLIPVSVIWLTTTEVRWGGTDGSCLPLFIEPIFMLTVLAALNALARRVLPRRINCLRQEELLIVYSMLVVSCTFAGHDSLQNLFGTITHPYWHATASNGWQALFFQYLPKWMVITDHAALESWYYGNVDIWAPDGRHYLVSWIVPLIAWGLFFLTLVGMYLCMTVIIRKAWIEDEKLAFPLVQIPLAMTADGAETSFFKNKLMWMGFAIGASIELLNGIHTIVPSVPELHVKLYDLTGLPSLADFFNTPPWSSMDSTFSSFYPFAIGIAYFMPTDLAFSCWFFFLMTRVFEVSGAAMGIQPEAGAPTNFPYFGEQTAGAWIGLAVILLYSGRHYLGGTLRSAWNVDKSDDRAEAVRYRYAYIGMAIGVALLSIFSRLIGLSWWVGLLFFGIVFLIGFTLTRVRAEFGTPHEINYFNPGQFLVSIFGTHALGPQNLTLISMLYWFNRGYRNHPMPNYLETFKMFNDKPEVRHRVLIGVFVTAMIVSLLSVYWANLTVTYAAGAEAKAFGGYKWWVGAETYNRLASWLTQPQPPASTGFKYIVGGFIFTLLLSMCRRMLPWWPFHPAGYALAVSFAMQYFWMPIMIAWLIKVCLIRYGGIRAYRAGIPFFIGLTVGDYFVGSLWAIIGCTLGIPTYKTYI